MTRYRRFNSLALVVGLAGMLPACASMVVSAHMQPGLDVSRYRTYAWGPVDLLPTGDARLDANPFFDARVRAAVEGQLAARGIQKVADAPDIRVHYHATVEQRLDVFNLEREYGSCTNDCPTGMREYEQGTLVIDVVDGRTERVVWRGWAQTDMSGLINDQKRLDRRIDDAVRRIFELFPRSAAGGATASALR
jgi:hypothetical protein